ncbi:MAG: hypothetical protein ABIX01_23665 [Chitinophagaceae bacterium]
MNIKLLPICLAALLCCSVCNAKIWRVNNNGGGGGNFTTAQEANDFSTQPGDTIHLEPSPNSYGNLTTTKRLVWISTGAFLGIHPGEQYSLTPGRIGLLSVNTGSENSVFSIYIGATANVNASNVRLERCYVVGPINLGPNVVASNDVVINCYSLAYMYIYTGTNHFVSNNIFESELLGGAGASGIVQNNVFNAVSTSPSSISNCTIQNNIFNKAVGAYTFTNCVVQYNMSGSGGVLPAGNFNQNNIPMASVFVNNNGSDDAAFILKAASPAIGSGAAGADMGAYGGTTPFKTALQPAIPAIYKITAPFVPAGNTMNVTFSTKNNN